MIVLSCSFIYYKTSACTNVLCDVLYSHLRSSTEKHGNWMKANQFSNVLYNCFAAPPWSIKSLTFFLNCLIKCRLCSSHAKFSHNGRKTFFQAQHWTFGSHYYICCFCSSCMYICKCIIYTHARLFGAGGSALVLWRTWGVSLMQQATYGCCNWLWSLLYHEALLRAGEVSKIKGWGGWPVARHSYSQVTMQHRDNSRKI